jgi:hypothetical protein
VLDATPPHRHHYALPCRRGESLAVVPVQIGGRMATEILILVVLLVALDVAALRWGYDSRDGFRRARR